MSLLKVKSLSIGLTNQSETLTNNVNFEIELGEIFALVGESGSGKSISALACCGLYPEPNGFLKSGEIIFEEKDLSKNSEKDWQHIRGNEISMISQEPGSALNPLMTIKKQMLEYFDLHESLHKEPLQRISWCLTRVGLESDVILNNFPHELSGGMQQRVMIAMSLLLEPKLLIADEPTTALDVTIQAQIMDLLLELQKEFNMSILFITHNLALVAQYCDRLAIMQNGEIVETGDVELVIQKPQSDYGKKLLSAIPRF
tara:strand:+ start:2973 stop:3746 length:774 start_codon:yes stop_codon:yes gene_type:complete